MTAPAVPGAGYARVSWGRWVVDCAAPLCTSALTLGPDLLDESGNIVRYGLTWGRDTMRCWDCSHVTAPIVWPRDPIAIQMMLIRRPDIRTRNWEPHETLDDLLVENVTHGLIPRELDLDGPDACVMQVVDGVLVGGLLLDALSNPEARRALTGGN